MGMEYTMVRVCDTGITCVEPSLPSGPAVYAWPGSSSCPTWRPLGACALSPWASTVPRELVARLTHAHPPLHAGAEV